MGFKEFNQVNSRRELPYRKLKVTVTVHDIIANTSAQVIVAQNLILQQELIECFSHVFQNVLSLLKDPDRILFIECSMYIYSTWLVQKRMNLIEDYYTDHSCIIVIARTSIANL